MLLFHLNDVTMMLLYSQIGELQDEVQGQTERLVSSAASTVRVEPNPPRRPGKSLAIADCM